jgi:hypothetical protein
LLGLGLAVASPDSLSLTRIELAVVVGVIGACSVVIAYGRRTRESDIAAVRPLSILRQVGGGWYRVQGRRSYGYELARAG